MKKYLVSVECAIKHNNKFLIIQRPLHKFAGGMLAFPGGTVEERDEINNHDILRSAAKREVFEEVGLTLQKPLSYITTCYFATNTGIPIIHSIFYCKLTGSLPTVVPCPQEVPAWFWMTQEEINRAENAPDYLKRHIEAITKLSC